MRRIAALTPDTAPPKSAELLGGIIARHGSVGEMVSTMAHSPATLQGYLDFSRAMKRAATPRKVSEKISLALQEWIGCGTCLAAHVDAARSLGLSETDIVLARQGTSTDARETALIAFALAVLAEPSSIGDADIERLRGHGWSDRVITEIPALVALNQLTGTFNLVIGLQPDVTARAS
ncbi:carboxymuconolactone decarboxylase family protein [Amycolatopsis tucumanensis]|uniref:Peroxidase-related enzyme n=1 Tax=Amycolatopsis tucumanensis TaxID=401106 RepID=A0ABP7JWB7_9PSEU|nr:carboxymuconolactone decarboxylase family protein [Amycolatopsis tucumanensis]MCF6428481.1 carboxymuconolactone decarboxylase family protein [Amycolatopsis tucumanensis]